MGFTDIIKKPWGLFNQPATERDTWNLMARIAPGGVGEPPYIGDLEMLRAYYRDPWMRAVTHRIAHQFAAQDWKLYATRNVSSGKYFRAKEVQRSGTYKARQEMLQHYKAAGELREITDHPFLTALADPNPFMSGLTMRMLTCLYRDLIGETFLLKERMGGILTGFWPIPPHWIRVTPTPQRPSYMVGYRGWQDDIPETEIIWTTDANPENPYGRGRGFGTALSYDIDINQYSNKHIAQWFYNGARPEMAITMEGLSQDEILRVRQDWQNQHQGFWRAFKTHFTNHKMDIQQINQSFSDLGVVELRKAERDIFLQVYGVPPEICGVIENSNRATIEAAVFIFALLVLVPRLEDFRADWQMRILPEYDDRLILDYVSPVSENDDYVLQVMQASPWAFMIDDWRLKAKFGPLQPNGAGATLMVPSLMIPTDPTQLPTETQTQPPTVPAAPKFWEERARKAKGGHGNEGNAQSLINWFNGGADGQIHWGSPGDFDACVEIAGKYLDDPQGFCQERHMDVTGHPAGHAPGESGKGPKA